MNFLIKNFLSIYYSLKMKNNKQTVEMIYHNHLRDLSKTVEKLLKM